MDHSFNTNVAKEYDVYTAILLNNFRFWTLTNLANQNNIHDGLCWTYNTVQAFTDIFPYWTRHQLEHLLSKCEKSGLIISGNYNSHKYDRKKWYALTAKAYNFFPELQQEHFIGYLYETISEKTEMAKLHPTLSEISEKSLGKFREAFLKNPEPIADSKQQIVNTDNKTYPADAEDSANNQFLPSTPQSSTSKQLSINDLLADNPHEIPEPMIQDWLLIRKTRKARVTKTGWSRLNKILTLIKEKTLVEPVDAFETMVDKTWQSLELKYFIDGSHGGSDKKQPAYTNGADTAQENSHWR